MAAKSGANEIKDLFLNVFELIVKCDQSVLRKIKKIQTVLGFDNEYTICFEFYKKGNWEEFCDCWYVHEYFEYCSEGTVNVELFNRILDNVRQSRCPHTADQPQEYVATSGVRLIHAASAANNKPVVQYLLELEEKTNRLSGIFPSYRTESAGLYPVVIAVLKNSDDVIKSNTESALFQNKYFKDRLSKICEITVWAVRDPANGTVKTVKVEHYQNFAEQHPFVWCFFLNITPSLKTIRAVVEYFQNYYDDNVIHYQSIQTILGHVLHTQDSKIATDIVGKFSQCITKYELDVALQCVLWNKPGALRLHRKINLDVRYSWYSLLSIAQFLGHQECIRALEDYRQSTDAKPKHVETGFGKIFAKIEREEKCPVGNASPYTCLVHLYGDCKYSVSCDAFCQLFPKIYKNNFDINQQDENCMTVLNFALYASISVLNHALNNVHCLATIIKAVCSLGADVNIKDKDGRSALNMALRLWGMHDERKPGSYDEMWTSLNHLMIFKLILTHNPIPLCTFDAVSLAVKQDENNHLLQFAADESTLISLSGGENKTVCIETLRDRYLAVSFVAILLELGFPLNKPESRLFFKLPDGLKHYLNKTLSTPRSLTSRCRNVIRETYPGPRLQEFLDNTEVPAAIADSILFQPFLSPTKIILPTGEVIDDIWTHGC